MGVVWLYLQNQETTKAGLLFAGLALGVIALLSFAQMYNIKDSDEKKKKALEAKPETKFTNAGSDIAAEKASANWGSDIDAEKAEANRSANLGSNIDAPKATVSFDIEEKSDEHKPSFVYMVVMLLVAGLVMSGWGPLLGFGSIDPTDPSTLDKLSPYGQMFWFALAIIISDLLFIPLILAFPVDGSPSVPFSAFVEGFKCGWKGHLLCFVGGMIWAFGFMGNTLSSSSCSLNRATSYAIGQCAPLAAIAWATLLWREFKGVRRIVWIFLLTSVAFYIGAVVLASLSRETSDNACDIVLSTPIPTTL
jgi:glucose uptake protein